MICSFSTKFGTMKCYQNDVVFYNILSKNKIYEEELILNKIVPYLKNKNIKIILDIGAHIGSHSVIYSSLFKDSEIYCFEPQKEIFNLLNSNIKDNNITNCKAFNTAVGHINTNTTMSKYLYDGYNCEINYNTNKQLNYGGIGLGLNGECIDMITIDSLNLENCDYIKIDVEGAEILTLLGAINTIKKFKPIITFEHTDKFVSDEMKESLHINFVIPEIKEYLQETGYKLFSLDDYNIIAINED